MPANAFYKTKSGLPPTYSLRKFFFGFCPKKDVLVSLKKFGQKREKSSSYRTVESKSARTANTYSFCPYFRGLSHTHVREWRGEPKGL